MRRIYRLAPLPPTSLIWKSGGLDCSISIDFNISLLICIGFHIFSIFIDFHGFSLSVIDLHRFTLIFNDFVIFPLVCIDLHWIL